MCASAPIKTDDSVRLRRRGGVGAVRGCSDAWQDTKTGALMVSRTDFALEIYHRCKDASSGSAVTSIDYKLTSQ